MSQKLLPTLIREMKIKLYNNIKEIEKEIKELKAKCSHVGSISYSSDPSGNNDSSYDCNACGASWRRWPSDVPYDLNN